MDPVLIGVVIIGQGGPRTISRWSIYQSIVQGGESIIRSNVITHVLTKSSEMTLKSDYFPFDPLKSQTLMITPLTEPFLTSDGGVRSTSEIGASRPDHSRIIAQSMNKDISSRDYVWSTVRSGVGEADKLDTAVQRYSSNKWNAAPSRIVEGSLKSIFPKIVEKSDSSERMNLANSLGVQTPKLILLMHLPMQTDNVGERRDGNVSLPE